MTVRDGGQKRGKATSSTSIQVDDANDEALLLEEFAHAAQFGLSGVSAEVGELEQEAAGAVNAAMQGKDYAIVSPASAGEVLYNDGTPPKSGGVPPELQSVYDNAASMLESQYEHGHEQLDAYSESKSAGFEKRAQRWAYSAG